MSNTSCNASLTINFTIGDSNNVAETTTFSVALKSIAGSGDPLCDFSLTAELSYYSKVLTDGNVGAQDCAVLYVCVSVDGGGDGLQY